MKSTSYVCWQDGNMWFGYLEELPDYLTQGETVKDLETHLRDIYEDVTTGKIPNITRGRN